MSKLAICHLYTSFTNSPLYSNWQKASLFEEDKHFTFTFLNHKPKRESKKNKISKK